MIAKIAVAAANFAIDKPYSYETGYGQRLLPGMRVMVPFGRGNKPSEGVVLQVAEGRADGLKTVTQVLDEQPLLSEEMLRLAAFLKERYFCTFYDAIRVMLPAGLWFQVREAYCLTEDMSWQNATIKQADALAILRFMHDMGAEVTVQRLAEIIPQEESLQKALRYLLRKKWIQAKTEFNRKTRDKTEKIAFLAVPAEEAMAYANGRPKSAALQRSILQTLCAVGSVAVKELCYFTGATTATVNRLEKLGYITLSAKPVLRCREIRPVKLDGPLELNQQQQAAFDGLSTQMAQDAPGTALLYGVTGSGKTSVYLKLIRQCLDMEKSAVLMVPEIALTPQLLGVLAAHFGDTVAVLHSSLPAGERYDQWKRIRSGEARVVVGTRSAVFAPCVNLGLMILDEE